MREPVLYLSLHFKEHRQTCCELLKAVRLSGDREAWLEFFADAVVASAARAATSAKCLLELASADSQRIADLGRAEASAVATHNPGHRPRPVGADGV